MWRKFIDDPIYRQGCELLIGGTEAQLIEYLRTRLSEPEYRIDRGTTGAAARTIFYVPDDGGKRRAYFVWFREWNGSPEDIGRLAHEATHHVHNVCRTVGVEDEEAYAYYIAWFVEQAVQHLTVYACDPRVKKRRKAAQRGSRKGSNEHADRTKVRAVRGAVPADSGS